MQTILSSIGRMLIYSVWQGFILLLVFFTLSLKNSNNSTLNYKSNSKTGSLQFAVAAKKNRNELLKRIKYLLSENNNYSKTRKPVNLLLPVTIFVVVLSITFSCLNNGNNNINQKQFTAVVEKYLPAANSSMVIYDTKNKQYLIFNDSLSRKQDSPVSTFKIASSLFALESGIAENKNFTIPWDSLKNPAEPWMLKVEMIPSFCRGIFGFYSPSQGTN